MSAFRGLGRNFSSSGRFKENRKTVRTNVGADAWVRNGFAVRSCKVVDLSNTGVQIRLNTAQTLPGVFTLMTSREGSGRQARVKWRRGALIGAEFL